MRELIIDLMNSCEWFETKLLGSTKAIGKQLCKHYDVECTTEQVRKEMKKLEKEGIVKKNEEWSSGSHICWEVLK